jgi:DNA-binding response OmpR family regulator
MIATMIGYAMVVDDEPANREFAERLLQMAEFTVKGAGTGAEALLAARSVPKLSLALIDMELPDASGISVIKTLRAENPNAVLIMATMHDDRALMARAFEAGCDVFLVKPHGFMELFRRIKDWDANVATLKRLIIDQYGPRPYRG